MQSQTDASSSDARRAGTIWFKTYNLFFPFFSLSNCLSFFQDVFQIIIGYFLLPPLMAGQALMQKKVTKEKIKAAEKWLKKISLRYNERV